MPERIFVLGGAASGKSAFAEQMILATPRPRHYIATAQAFDPEMTAKISRHRDQRGTGWITHDAPLTAPEVLADLPAGSVALFDSVTLWLSNQLLADHDLTTARATLIAALDTCKADVVLVSDEVGAGIVPDNKMARQFREALGRLNIALAAQCSPVVHVVAGLPHVLKGELP